MRRKSLLLALIAGVFLVQNMLYGPCRCSADSCRHKFNAPTRESLKKRNCCQKQNKTNDIKNIIAEDDTNRPLDPTCCMRMHKDEAEPNTTITLPILDGPVYVTGRYDTTPPADCFRGITSAFHPPPSSGKLYLTKNSLLI